MLDARTVAALVFRSLSHEFLPGEAVESWWTSRARVDHSNDRRNGRVQRSITEILDHTRKTKKPNIYRLRSLVALQ
jgi:hypothetical protein